MFWRNKSKAAEPYIGSAFDFALTWCQGQGERVIVRDENAFDVLLGKHKVHIERHEDDKWLNARAILPEISLSFDADTRNRLESYEKFSQIQLRHLDLILDLLPNGQISMRFTKLMHFQGNPHLMVFNMLSTFDYALNGSEERFYPSEACYFYVNGKKFIHGYEGLIFYMEKIRKASVVELNDDYVSFDTGGLACIVSFKAPSQEFIIRYGFSDFLDTKNASARQNAQLFAAAYRKPNTKTMSYCFEDGASELAISGVLTAGTEARPIFTRTLAEIYQVVLDSTERIKMNPGLVDGSQVLHSEEESLKQAALFQGELTGGSENLEESL